MWYYIQSEPGLWTVGCDTDRGWTTDSDHDVQEAAAQRVSFLNGNTDDFVRHLIAERANLRQQLAAAQQELHDLRIRAGSSRGTGNPGYPELLPDGSLRVSYEYTSGQPAQAEFDPDEQVIVLCPRCGAEHVDMDGFGVIYCTCGYCVHPQTDGGVCGICGQPAE